MQSDSREARPFLSRQRSNSVPTLGLAGISAEEAGMLFSAAERATARRKRPVSVDSPGPVIERSFDMESIPVKTFNFSTPSRHGFGTSPLRHVQRSESVHTVASEPSRLSPQSEEDLSDVEPTPLASAFPASTTVPRSPSISASPLSPRRIVGNPVLKAYADGLFTFTQSRLNDAAPKTLKTLGLRRDASLPPTPDLDVNELPRPPRPPFQSQFSDWSSTRASSVINASELPSPNEPQTPDDQLDLMTPDSFFAEITPRVAQTAQWARALNAARVSSNLAEASFFIDSPTMGHAQRQRASSVTSSEAMSYFAGFDGATEAAGTRLSNDYSTLTRQTRMHTSVFIPRSQPGSSASNNSPYVAHGAGSPYDDMMSLSRTPSWQVSAMG